MSQNQIKTGITLVFFGVFVLWFLRPDNNTASHGAELGAVPFPKYNDVVTMLDSSNDFSREHGTLVLLSSNPLHVQISSGHPTNESQQVIKQFTKRDIIYVAFQAFAQTDVYEIRLTSLPLLFDVGKEKVGKPLNYLKQVMYINRGTAVALLKKYTNSSDFKTLYKQDGSGYVPSDTFNSLMHSNMEAVFDDMLSKCKCGFGYIEPR